MKTVTIDMMHHELQQTARYTQFCCYEKQINAICYGDAENASIYKRMQLNSGWSSK